MIRNIFKPRTRPIAETPPKRPPWRPTVLGKAKTANGDDLLDSWLTATNPLTGLSITSAQSLFDCARRGDTRQLHWLYNEMEAAMPVLMVCAERRSAALSNIDWQIHTRKPTRARGWDKNLAAEQSACLEQAFGDAEVTNLSDAVEHLSQAFFRGFAHISPLWTADKQSLRGFDLLPGWAFSRRRGEAGTEWIWHTNTQDTGEPIPPGELCSLTRTRHVDYPAMAICLRMALGESKWGQFLERYGIPPVIIIMPPDIDPNLDSVYREAAEKVADGGSGALPHLSTVNYAADSRGLDPFSDFLQHQNEMLVLMATGGLLTSLTGATGIGDGTSNAHEATWDSIVGRDAVVVGDGINRGCATPILNAAFPGQPHLAQFVLERTEAPTADEVFEAAGKARVAGYVVNQAQLEERSGYKLERVELQPEQPGGYSSIFNADTAEPNRRRTANADLRGGKTGENAPKAKEAPAEGETPSDALTRSLDDYADALLAATTDAMMHAAATPKGNNPDETNA